MTATNAKRKRLTTRFMDFVLGRSNKPYVFGTTATPTQSTHEEDTRALRERCADGDMSARFGRPNVRVEELRAEEI